MAIQKVAPPPIIRPRDTNLDMAVVQEIAGQLAEGEYLTNGETHKTKKQASNAAQVFRRHVARVANVPEKQVRSRVWDQKGGNDPEKGEWIFALTLRKSGEAAPDEE